MGADVSKGNTEEFTRNTEVVETNGRVPKENDIYTCPENSERCRSELRR